VRTSGYVKVIVLMEKLEFEWLDALVLLSSSLW
jgi:hypothetical protein